MDPQLNPRAALALALLLLTACAGPGPEEPPTQAPPTQGPNAAPRTPEADPAGPEETILALADTRVADPEPWEPLLAHADARTRARAARAAGRVRAGSLVPLLLARLEAEADPTARRELVFALGQSEDARAVEPLTALLAAEAPLLRAEAAAALAKLDDPAPTDALIALLADGDARVRAAALLALPRLRGRRVQPPRPLPAEPAAALSGTLARLSDDPDVSWQAVFALANLDLPGRVAPLLAAARKPERHTRVFAVRGLSRVEDQPGARLALFVDLLTDPDPHVASVSAAALGSLGDLAALPFLIRTTRIDRRPADHHVRRAAFGALATLASGRQAELDELTGGELADALHAGLADPDPATRATALIAAARILDVPYVRERLLPEWVASDDPLSRVAAARAAPHVAAQDELLTLSRDPDPRVASEALSALGELDDMSDAPRQAALRAIQSDDMAIRGTGFSLLQEVGTVEDMLHVEASYDPSRQNDAEGRAEAVAAAAALGKESALDFLRRVARDDPAASVRRKAADAIEALTGERAPVSAPAREKPSSVGLVVGRDVFSDAPNPRATLHTSRGPIVLELYREQAPLHVKSFLQLAAAGRYDGLPFHRVVTGFVIQGLDPRGDGWGTGGVFLRDEINPVAYGTGALGMPNSGHDTAGCQIFVTHLPTPHLDGRYTVFGAVVDGLDVVDAIGVGAVCERVERIR